jgi:hypothetical protein
MFREMILDVFEMHMPARRRLSVNDIATAVVNKFPETYDTSEERRVLNIKIRQAFRDVVKNGKKMFVHHVELDEWSLQPRDQTGPTISASEPNA